jgi:hypothetical protein
MTSAALRRLLAATALVSLGIACGGSGATGGGTSTDAGADSTSSSGDDASTDGPGASDGTTPVDASPDVAGDALAPTGDGGMQDSAAPEAASPTDAGVDEGGLDGATLDAGTTDASDAAACPVTQPTPGTACPSKVVCSYGTTDCDCAGGKWACGTCPATEPTNGATCPTANLVCDYGSDTCLCETVAVVSTWHCNAPCPMSQPSPGQACSTPANEMCTYGSVTCICEQGAFFCN